MIKNIVYIPARYASKRFPGKLLKKIEDRTIIERLVQKVKNIDLLPIIVSGDKEIISFVKKKKIKFYKSKKKHISGMSRVSEVIKSKSQNIIFLLFGDELYLSEKNIQKFVNYVNKNKNADSWHLLTNIKTKDKNDKNVVKCLLNNNKEIIDLSRSYKRNYNYKCVGLFAFKKEILKKYSKFNSSDRELTLKIEQFKLLDNKIKIKSMCIKNIKNSINSIKDLK